VLTEAQTEINVTTFIAHRSLGVVILASVSKISNPKIESYQCVPHIVTVFLSTSVEIAN